VGSDLYIAASGAVARMRQLDVLANDLANAETPGFKRQTPVFEAVLQSALVDGDGHRQPGAPGRSFVGAADLRTDLSPGPVKRTGRPLDVAIQGEGFLVVETPRGERYTRAGALEIRPDRVLSTPDGLPVLGEGGPLVVGTPGTQIGPDGSLRTPDGQVLGRLRVVEFDAPGRLTREGAGLFAAPEDEVPRDVERPAFLPGSLEGSNVDPVAAMARLVVLQRAFQSNLKALEADDSATGSLIREFSS